ncbi:MAG: hypothetical protein ACXIVQ_15825 [Acidimicrobiales bacterium]
MLVCTSWTNHPAHAGDIDRIAEIWTQIESDLAARSDLTRLCWYANVAGTRGVMVSEIHDPTSALEFQLECHLALAPYFELTVEQVVDIDTAARALIAARERVA